MSIATVVGGYLLKEQRKADELRAQILRVHETELEEPARLYREFRSKLERLILEASSKPPTTYVEPRLKLSGLRSGRGLYLRLPSKKLNDAKQIDAGARAMTGDAIAACLGLSPSSARGLWEKGDFLMPDWIEDTRDQDAVMHLRVTDEMLARHIRADLPSVLNLLRSQWFLLVIEQGPNRRDHPVDVFLWDLRSEQRLLAARVQSAGLLLPVRLRFKDAPAAPAVPPERLQGGGANDCSIAAQLRQLAGAALAEVENAPPEPVAPVPASGAPSAALPASTAPAAAPADTAEP